MAGGVLLTAWVWQQTWRGPVAELVEKRAELAQLHATVRAPIEPRPHLLPTEQMFVARGGSEANMALQARLLRTATIRGLLAEEVKVQPVPVHSPILRATVAVSGPEDKIWQYIADIEAGQPVIRFSNWRLKSLAGGSVQLEAEAVAIWSPGP